MKRNVALLLTSLLLVFSLTACGKDQQPGDAGGSSMTDTDNNGTASNGTIGGTGSTAAPNGTGSGAGSGTASNGTGNGAGSGTASNGTGNGADGGDILDEAGDAARNVARDVGGAVTGRTSTGMNGLSYEQMLQNGRVF